MVTELGPRETALAQVADFTRELEEGPAQGQSFGREAESRAGCLGAWWWAGEWLFRGPEWEMAQTLLLCWAAEWRAWGTGPAVRLMVTMAVGLLCRPQTQVPALDDGF